MKIEAKAKPNITEDVADEHALRSVLTVLSGIGDKTQTSLHSSGIHTWDDLDRYASTAEGVRWLRLREDIHKAEEAVSRTDISFFAARLKRSDHWRIAAAFPQRVIFLDIETTGLSHYYHDLTLVGWSNRGKYNVLTSLSDDASFASLTDFLTSPHILVTYNGSHFDLPFLKRKKPGLIPNSVHVDLRHLGARAGLTGGQKLVEKTLGWKRPTVVSDLNGEIAPALWFKYRRGDLDSLRALVEYNHADVEGLNFLLTMITRRIDSSCSARWAPSPFRDWLERDSDLDATQRILRISNVPFRPRLTINDFSPLSSRAVVGIDLSGSEGRPTGWANVTGQTVTTRKLYTDEEIVRETVRCSPHLVSIDAPLSLPLGRVSVDDSDPGRAKFGITRRAERILAGRGVKSYPALIMSMQKLTARGIRMSQLLRAEGIPVIESFPGAAQDILGMPRKGLSKKELKSSLAEFGYRGQFISDEISHDEIDAISSALVGQGFLANRFEALGSEDENYMIVPSVEAGPSRRLITVSGRTGAGKTTLVQMMAELGLATVRYSAVLATQAGTLARSELQAAGLRANLTGDQRSLNKAVYDQIRESPHAIVDGLRYAEDYAYAVEQSGGGHVHVHVDTDRHTRRIRWSAREKADGDKSFDYADSSTTESNQEWFKTVADVVFDNNGPVSELEIFAQKLARGEY